MTTTKTALGLWTPANDTVETVGRALCEHWVAAKKAAADSPFFRRSANWLDLTRHHLTIGGKLIRYASGSASVPNPNRVPRS